MGSGQARKTAIVVKLKELQRDGEFVEHPIVKRKQSYNL